jgi:hypothetical protein
MIWVLFERGALGTQAGSQRLIRRGRAGTARTRSTGAHRGTGASGALDLGFSPVGARIRKKVSGKTATSFGNCIRRQTPGRGGVTSWATRSRTGLRTASTSARSGP